MPINNKSGIMLTIIEKAITVLKKILSILFILLMMLTLMGCEKMVDLKPDEVDMIAQGSAWLLLKHDKTYAQKLITPTATPTPRPTFSPTPSPTPKVNPKVTPTPGGEDPEKKNPNEKAFAELKEVIGLSDITLDYGGYDFYDNYMFESVSVEPSKPGNKLMIVKILINNNGNAPVTADFLSRKFDIRLDSGSENGSDRYSEPLRSLINNDFCLLNTSIDAKETFESVLVFDVKKEFNPKSMNLFITKDDKTVIIKLK